MDPAVDAQSERLASWHDAAGAWHPHPLSRPDEPLPRGQRVVVALVLAAAHVAAFWALAVGSRVAPDAVADTVTTLVFIAPEEPPVAVDERPLPPELVAPPVASDPVPPIDRRVAAGHAPASPRGAEASRAEEGDVVDEAVDPGAMVAVEPAPADSLRLFDADGSIALPADVVERLAAVDADSRPFEFRMPGVVESGRFLDRPPALAFESTRFDRYWIPEKDALTRILEKAVEATTATVEIPIPGTRGGYLVCSVTVLALGGGCGVRNNSDGYVVRGDDPATLSPEEDAQCRAWWDQIVAARDQDAWRHTRALYDSSCRKPLATSHALPARG